MGSKRSWRKRGKTRRVLQREFDNLSKKGDIPPWNDNDPYLSGIGHNSMEQHVVTLFKDHILEYPPLYFDVFVATDKK